MKLFIFHGLSLSMFTVVHSIGSSKMLREWNFLGNCQDMWFYVKFLQDWQYLFIQYKTLNFILLFEKYGRDYLGKHLRCAKLMSKLPTPVKRNRCFISTAKAVFENRGCKISFVAQICAGQFNFCSVELAAAEHA